MEYLLVEILKIFPKNSTKGLVFGAGIGLLSLIFSTNYDGDKHLLAHIISATFSLLCLSFSIIIFTFKIDFQYWFQKENVPLNRYFACRRLILSCLLFLIPLFSLIFGYCMVKFDEEMTLFLTRCIDKILGLENGDGYFFGFISCYAIICFLLFGFLETIYEALSEMRANSHKIND
jgi:hypothetical protein